MLSLCAGAETAYLCSCIRTKLTLKCNSAKLVQSNRVSKWYYFCAIKNTSKSMDARTREDAIVNAAFAYFLNTRYKIQNNTLRN